MRGPAPTAFGLKWLWPATHPSPLACNPPWLITPGYHPWLSPLPLQLSNGLLSLELSSTGSGELSAALSGGTAISDAEPEAEQQAALPVSWLLH